MVSDVDMVKKVDRVVALAPCFYLDLGKFEIALNDKPSAVGFTKLLDDYGIDTLFGDTFEDELDAKMCPTEPNICANLKGLNTAVKSEYPDNSSTKNFEHLVQLSLEKRVQEYISMPEEYLANPISDLIGIEKI